MTAAAPRIEEAQGQAGSVYGRQMYEVMRYWDDDHPETLRLKAHDRLGDDVIRLAYVPA